MNTDMYFCCCCFCTKPLGDGFEILRSDYCQNTYNFCILNGKKKAIFYVHSMARTLILKGRQPQKTRSKVFRILIAICIFRTRAEEHEVLFIIAIVSTIKMTIGNKFKAGLPKCFT